VIRKDNPLISVTEITRYDVNHMITCDSYQNPIKSNQNNFKLVKYGVCKTIKAGYCKINWLCNQMDNSIKFLVKFRSRKCLRSYDLNKNCIHYSHNSLYKRFAYQLYLFGLKAFSIWISWDWFVWSYWTKQWCHHASSWYHHASS
jgi:hypothetical protein